MKYDLDFNPPLMNAAGTLGFAPEPEGLVDISQLGAFVTNPVSLFPRSPANEASCVTFPGGFLLHTGHPNPGLRAVIRQNQSAWERSALPILVHLLCQEPAEVQQMVKLLEGLPGIAGIELGLPPGVSSWTAGKLVEAATGELPLIVRLPYDRIAELAPAIASQFPHMAVSLAPPRGKLRNLEGKVVTGRLYGPALFAQSMLALEEALSCDLLVIAGGGIYSQAQAQWLLESGAWGVQLDSLLWRNGLRNWTS